MEGNNIRIITIGVLVSVWMVFGCPVFLHRNDAYISLLHHFFHANIFHLAVNGLAVWTLFRNGANYKTASLLLAFIIASLSWFCSSSDVVGFSNVIYAVIGLRTPSIRDRWWRNPSVILFLAVTALMGVLPQVSAVTHIASFVLGCVAAGMQRVIKNINRDFRRASYH